ncbi:hypothetical protein MAR_031927 [Mya arenaria]|uniref:Uncharacterized protein n=1 Tax=Mya arenaria TaxID=6604 RepID=A0ABY7F9H6_MYAAR|nr:hypothetical protein MAR_031927 [Mya arenaria]
MLRSQCLLTVLVVSVFAAPTKRFLFQSQSFLELHQCPPDCRRFLSEAEFRQLLVMSTIKPELCESHCSNIMAANTSPILIRTVCPSVCKTIERMIYTEANGASLNEN